ncbi:putative F-box domain, leucine-rich repeat domain superfamily, F-box-like domain superfamily [Helianthus debilis subsp. tardiflorus]
MMNQQKAIKLEQPTRNWLDLPPELMANILYRIGVVGIFESVEKVCTAWRKICKDPAMWMVVYMDGSTDPNGRLPLDKMCEHAVDRSKGQLVDITITEFDYAKILVYIAERSSRQLRRLTMARCYDIDYMDGIWTKALKKLPLLEELSLYETKITRRGIKTAGRYCSMLKTLKVIQEEYRLWDEYGYGEFKAKKIVYDRVAMAIGQNLHELRHLELIGNPMSNKGLGMILDGCHHLELLDLRACFFVDLDGDLGKRCLQQIKRVKLPYDSLEGCPFIYQNDGMTCDVDDE